MNPIAQTPHRRPALATTALTGSALVITALLASGCSVLQEDRIDYRSARPAATLEVPPDLTQLQRDSRFVAPGTTAVTAAGFQLPQPGAAALPTATVQVGDVRIERAGDQRWLVVNRPPEQLWSPIRDFWQANGFLLTLDQQQLGLMETDWAENRAQIPQDIIRATLGRLFDTLYSTGERDRFRTRLERRADGGTEIFISHRGMIEVFNERRDSTLWQPRPTNHELEAEFLRRLMVQLGVTQEQAQALVAAATPAQPLSRIETVNNLPVLQLDEGFDRAWRRVGLALDRTGFTVEDRDRAQACTLCASWPPMPPPRAPNRASLAASWVARGRRQRQRRSATASWCAAPTTAARSRCSTPPASPPRRRWRSASCKCWPPTCVKRAPHTSSTRPAAGRPQPGRPS